MSKNTILAINFEYTLLEFYKKLSLNENDLAVIFMIKHLLSQNNTLITADLLSIKMNLSVNEIDQILVSLMKKGYIAYVSSSKGMITSLTPLEEKLSNLYQIELAKDASKTFKEHANKAIENIYQVFEKELGRTLSPVEFSLIDEWINDGIDEHIIIDALHEAIAKRKLSLKAVDKIIMQLLTRNDIEKEGHSAISSSWKENIDKSIDIAQKKWSNKDENK